MSINPKRHLDPSDIGSAFEVDNSALSGITARAGGGQALATLLTRTINRITTVASANDSVKLPPAKAGMIVYVINAAAANSMNCFPATGGVINALSPDAAFAIAANKAVIFVCAVDGTWNTNLTA